MWNRQPESLDSKSHRDASLERPMKASDLATIGLRLLGIFYLVSGLSGVFAWLYNLQASFPEDGRFAMAVVLVHSGVLAVVGVVFLFASEQLIRWLFPDLGESSIASPRLDLHRLAFAVVGVGIATWTAPYAVSSTVELIWFLGGERRHLLEAKWASQWTRYLEAYLAVAFGILLYLLAPRLAKSVRTGIDDRTCT